MENSPTPEMDQVLAKLLGLMVKQGQLTQEAAASMTPPFGPIKMEEPKVDDFDSLVNDFMASDPTKLADPEMDPDIAGYLGLTVPGKNSRFPFSWEQVEEYEGRMVEVLAPLHALADKEGKVAGVLTPRKRREKIVGWEVHPPGGEKTGFDVTHMVALGVRTYKRIDDTSEVPSGGLVTGVKFNGGSPPYDVIEGTVVYSGRAYVMVDGTRVEIDHSTGKDACARWAINDPEFKPPAPPTPRPQKEGRCQSCSENAGKFECNCGPRPTRREAAIGIVEVRPAGTRMTKSGNCFDCADASDICGGCKECTCCNEHASGCLLD